jgi:oligopeptide/dipeptide ABC transporter ATP-binding protein
MSTSDFAPKPVAHPAIAPKHDLGIVPIFTNRCILMTGRRKNPFQRSTKKGPLCTVPGSPPDLPTPTPGCPFVPRCEYAEEQCTIPTIALKEVAPGHFSARLRIELKEIDLASAHLTGSLSEMNGRTPEPV